MSDSAAGRACSTATQTIGSFLFAANNLLPVNTALQVAGGATFDLNGNNQIVGSLSNGSGSGGSIINSNAGLTAVLLDPTGGSTTFGGTIQGGGTRAHQPGSQRQRHASAIRFEQLHGHDTRSGGTLLLANTGSLSGSTFDTSGGGSLNFGSLTTPSLAVCRGPAAWR